MRVQTLDTILSADPEFFSRHAVGDLVGVVIDQTTAAGQAVLAVIKQLSIALLIAVYVAILLAISVPLTLIAVVFAGVVSHRGQVEPDQDARLRPWCRPGSTRR